MKISALWITKNEEANIERSIKSVADVADEIIVVDTGSTDKTVSIAEAAGAKIYHFEWINDFSAARNFAMDSARGDVCIFLDADEWFEPKLKKSDKSEITQIFSNNTIDGIMCTMFHLTGTGGVKATSPLPRIFRLKGMRFEGRIHEAVKRLDGRILKLFGAKGWKIKHTGYANDLAEVKSARNLEILNALHDDSTKLTTSEKVYLMRENYYVTKSDEAVFYLTELLKSKKKIAELAESNPDLAITYFYTAISVAALCRSKVSRKDIYAKIVEHFKKTMPNYPGSASIDLAYSRVFERNERKFLEMLREYEKTKQEYQYDDFLHDDAYKFSLQRIYYVGADAELSRGNKEEAMQYALKAITAYTDKVSGENNLKTFVRAAKGAAETEMVLLLNKVQDLMHGDMEDVLESLMYGYLKNIYFYFFKKQYDAGQSTKARFLYLKILNGSHREAIATAIANRSEMKEEDFNEVVFCAAVCAEDYELFLENKEYMGQYKSLADAYFENYVIADPKWEDVQIYMREYKNIVFAAGKRAGDRFLAIFGHKTNFGLVLKCEYYMDGGLYEEFLSEERAVETYTLEPTTQIKFAQCYLLAGQYAEALEIIRYLFETNQLDYGILNVMAVIAEKATGTIQTEAQELYDTYSVLFEEILDLQDIQNTGIIFDEVSKKELRALASLTPQNFKKEMFNADVVTSVRVLDVYEVFANLYIEKEFYGMAERYLRKLLVSGHKLPETYAKLSEVYGKIGNAALADEFAKSGKAS